MTTTAWPLFDLRVRTPRLTLRMAREDELLRLAERAAGRVLEPSRAAYMSAWTQRPSPAFEREFMQFHWRLRADWSPSGWELALMVFPDGLHEPVGSIGAMTHDFPVLRTVTTGSWLLPEARGRGLGRETRAAMIELCFRGLGARECRSAAHPENAASLGVSRSLGYVEDGTEPMLAGEGEGEAVQSVRTVLPRSAWVPREDIEISGLEGCAELFGL